MFLVFRCNDSALRSRWWSLFFVVHIITAVSPWQDYPQAYNVGTVGSQRCGPTSTAEDGIPADGSLGEIKEEALADKTRIIQD